MVRCGQPSQVSLIVNPRGSRANLPLRVLERG
jgi:hypothetical protein